uniref:Uncharacterized protein n=1 Tax=Oryza glumipatula TaxID=40148 RepID=A0A0D9ZGQ7_9ORYZ
MAAAAAWRSLSRGVRRAALELRQWSERGAASLAPDEDELEAVERQLDVGPTSVRSPVKRKAKLPESWCLWVVYLVSYEMLCEFFNCFESSTQLLRMKGSKASFPNICATIQHLSERWCRKLDWSICICCNKVSSQSIRRCSWCSMPNNFKWTAMTSRKTSRNS